jgi:hypothetical protein
MKKMLALTMLFRALGAFVLVLPPPAPAGTWAPGPGGPTKKPGRGKPGRGWHQCPVMNKKG